MKKMICESSNKESITFKYAPPFILTNVSGIHEVLGEVVGSKSAFGVGERYIDTNIKKRNIIIECSFKDDVINKRSKLYKVFPLKDVGTLYYYENDLARKIDYVVESVKITTNTFYKKVQISLICPSPYFKDIKPNIYSMATWSPAFKFPLVSPVETGFKFGTKNITSMSVVENETNIESGIIIKFKANDTVVNPSLFNVDSREELKIEKTLNAGDTITIDTHRQNKNIYYFSALTGETQNINNYIFYDSKFLQVHKGTNTFRCNADEGVNNLECTLEYYTEYEAI